MSYFYKPPKNILSYISFFILVYLTSFILYFIGRFITEFVIIGIFFGDPIKAINFFLENMPKQSYFFEFFMPYILSVPIIFIAGIIAYVFNLGTLGARSMTKIYIKIASGKIGNIIGLVPLFKFGGTWVVEKKAKDEINLSTGRGMFKELVAERGNDVLLFSALVGAFLLIILEKINLISLAPDKFLFNNLINEADFMAIIVAFITIFVLCFYLPSMWIFRDGEIKKIVFDEEGDIKAVTNVANTYREGIGLFVGFSGLIGIGNIALNWLDTIIAQNNLSGIPTVLKYAGVYLYALGFFLIFASFLVPGISLSAIRYMKNHERFILSTRQRILRQGIGKSGSIGFKDTDILSNIESSLEKLMKQ